ncbi:MAG: permease [Lentisphaeraceae bacterium]|nr:permease [Lentisphaeraceae bacterium]
MIVFAENLWAIIEALGMWFLLGLFIAALMHVFVPHSFFKRWLGKSSIGNVVKAAFIGVPMPLCSCGVVPTVIAMKKKGASDSSCLSFLVSTPQTGVDSVLVSASFLSWPFAIFKLLSAFVIGIAGGALHCFFIKETVSEEDDLEDKVNGKPVNKLKAIYDFAYNELFYTLWRWMLAGIIISALLSTYISADYLNETLFADAFYGSIAALFLSIPMYICATSSVPIAAVLVAKGMSPAVAIVFLIAGPATNIATLGLIYKAFGKSFTAIYLLVVSLGSLICAWCFESVISTSITGHLSHHHHEGALLEYIFAIIFSIALCSFLIRDIRSFILSLSTKSLPELQMNVYGMSCQGCVRKIRNYVVENELADDMNGDPQGNSVTFLGRKLNAAKLRDAVLSCGFKLE